MLDYFTKYQNKSISYVYVKYNSKWYPAGIRIINSKVSFTYLKAGNSYKLSNYYIGDVAYDANGKYLLTRTVIRK